MKRITKKEVIEAIISEPLESGSWHQNSYAEPDDGKCNVCAVGAILRQVKPGFSLWDGFNSVDNEKYFMIHPDIISWENRTFLQILSTEFESALYSIRDLHNTDDSEEVNLDRKAHFQRFHALMIAQFECPEILEIDI